MEMTVTLSQKDADFVLGVLRQFAVLNESAIAVMEKSNETISSSLRRKIDSDDTVPAGDKDSVKFFAETISSVMNDKAKSALSERREKIMRSIELLTVGSDKE